jgi:hypothetical protein
VDRFSDLDPKEQKDCEFLYRQLDVIDKKAHNILLVGSTLIVISTLSILFSGEAKFLTRVIATVAVLTTLASITVVIWTTELSWSFHIGTLIQERDNRTNRIKISRGVLFGSLVLYVLAFLVDLLLTLLNISK